MKKTILSVRDLEKFYSNYKILHNVSFDVGEGEILALLGPNGAGKSTIIRCIMELLHLDSGSIQFNFDKSRKIQRKKIGYLPEERGLYKNVKVIDMLMYLADLKDYPKIDAKKRINYYLEKFDLKGKENVILENLSKGMAQKVQFIGTIIHEPELLILDEPFSGLDPVSQELLKQEVRELASKGTAIILSSHQMNLVEEMCDQVLLIHQGKQMIYGSLEDIKLEYANMKCIIYGNNREDIFNKIQDVKNIEYKGNRAILYLKRDIHITEWILKLPKQLDVIEMNVKRISLHEIFIAIATERYDNHGGVGHASYNESCTLGN